jgi:hypothetical protein
MMRTNLVVAIAAVVVMVPSVLLADTFRCGSKLVTQDSPLSEIKAKCGEPSHKEVSDVQPTARTVNGTVQRLPTIRMEVWTYNRESNAPGIRVTIADGKVTKIESVE